MNGLINIAANTCFLFSGLFNYILAKDMVIKYHGKKFNFKYNSGIYTQYSFFSFRYSGLFNTAIYR